MKALGIALAVLIAIAALGFGARVYANRAMSTRAVTPKTLGSVTPANAGLPFSRVAVEAGDRTLIGWWVKARADSGKVAPAILFLHGNRSSISDYVDLQRFFYRQGISSLVFDYSGFGASGGSPSLENAIADAGRVARVFKDSAGEDARRIAMGSALGSTVLLQAIDSIQPHVNGLVIEGVDASVLESAVRAGRVPKVVAPLVVDPANNVAAAARVRVPLLAIHSYDDPRVPIADAQEVVEAVPSRSSLVRHWRKGHAALLSSSRPCDWAPVLSFVKEGALPAAKIDTVDACKAEAARVAAAAKADSLKADSARADSARAASARAASQAAATKAAATKAPATKTGATTAGPTKTKAGTTKRPPATTTKRGASKSPTKRP
jgi:pimeloyl-ACP methyl ester carboxylesterase